MKTLFYMILVFLFFFLLLFIPSMYLIVNESKKDVEFVKKNCLESGGTSVEYQGKFERCIK